MRRTRHISAKGVLVLAAATTLAGAVGIPASASTAMVIDVFPGPNAISSALQGASSGDVLSVHTGVYPERVVVLKSGITIRSAGDGPVTVDGECGGSTFFVGGNSIVLDGLRIIGGDFFNVDYRVTSGGAVRNSSLRSTCPGAEYGVNAFDTGPLTVEDNRIQGFDDAGIYIGGIVDTGGGTLIARRNDLFGNDRGIIVEDSAGVSLILRNNLAHDNVTAGIFLHNSDGIRILRNTVEDNGFAGIELDDLSDGNLVGGNRARGHVFDLANDGGAGNCFVANTYTTSFGTIGC